MKYTLSVLAENQPGVLSKVVSLFSRRGYNIDSLAVGATEDPTVSRMTIVGEGDDRILEQVEKQLNKVIQVIKVRSLGPDATQAELMLVKLGCDPQSFGEINQIAALMKAEVVSVSKHSVTLKYSGEHEKCDTLKTASGRILRCRSGRRWACATGTQRLSFPSEKHRVSSGRVKASRPHRGGRIQVKTPHQSPR